MQVPKYNHKFLVMYHIDIFQNKLNVHHNFVNIPQYITHIQNISEVIKKKGSITASKLNWKITSIFQSKI